jgi:GT2 family glycosyltransferase
MAPLRTSEVSVVIICWNSAAYLPRCLAALEAQTYRDFEVILVDNASTDDGLDGVEGRYPGLQIRIESLDGNRGFAPANNVGARLATGDWLALLNADAFPEPGWLQQLMQAAAAHPGAFFASRQLQAHHPDLLDGEGDVYFPSGLALRRNYNKPVTQGTEIREVFSACAAAALYARQAFLEAGGFDEDFFAYHEDVDLGFRLRLRGLRCLLVPEAVVKHIGAASSGRRSDFSTYHGHRNLVWTYVKNMPGALFWLYLPLHLGMNLFSILYFTAKGQGRAIWRAKLDALRGLGSALQKRKAIQMQRREPVSSLWHAMDRTLFGPLQGWTARNSGSGR